MDFWRGAEKKLVGLVGVLDGCFLLPHVLNLDFPLRREIQYIPCQCSIFCFRTDHYPHLLNQNLLCAYRDEVQAHALGYRNSAVIINITQAIIQSISSSVPETLLLVDDSEEPPLACGAEELAEDSAEEDGVDASADVAAAGVRND
jgi:hypothetical protein